MRLFANRVLPMLQRDAAFAGPASVVDAAALAAQRADGVFAPA